MSKAVAAVTESRLFRAQETILQQMLEGSSLQQLLDQIASVVDELSSDGIANILLLDDDGVHVVHSAAPQLPFSYNHALEGVAIGSGVGSCGTAMHERRQVISTDISSDPLWKDFRELALAHDLHACWSTPIVDAAGKVLGSFALYYRETRGPDEQDLLIISRISHLLGVAIEHCRSQRQLKGVRRALKEKGRQLETLVANLPGMVYRVRQDERWSAVWVSDGARDLTGFTPEELTAEDSGGFVELIHPEDMPRLVAEVERSIAGGQPYSFSYRLRTRKGNWRWVWERGRAVSSIESGDVHFEGVITDISDIKDRERALARANRSLRMLSQCNEALVRAECEAELLQGICDVVVDTGEYPLSWIALPANSESGWYHCHSWSAADDRFSLEPDDLRFRMSGEGVLRPLLEDQLPVLVRGFGDVPGLPIAEQASALELGNGLFIPLCDGDQLLGVFILVAPVGDAISRDELGLLGELASDLAYGIVSRRSRIREEQLNRAVINIASAFQARSGADFLERLADKVAETVGSPIVGIGRLLPGDLLRARIVAGQADGKSIAGTTYDLSGTPCESMLGQASCVVPEAARETYPEDDILHKLGVESYVGHRLEDADGNPIGLIFALFREPVVDPDFILSALGIFAAGAAGELDRLERHRQIEEQAALLDQTRDAIMLTDQSGCIEYWNRGAEQIFGWSAPESLGQNCTEFLGVDAKAFEHARGKLEANGYWQGNLDCLARSGRRITVEFHWTLTRDESPQSQSPESEMRILQVGADVTRRQQDEARIHRLAFYDEVTGLPNRVLAMERLHEILVGAAKQAGRAALMIINLSRFKEINESLGHAVGDQALKAVAERLSMLCGESDFLARLGGDEFLLLLPGRDEPSALIMARQVGEALSRPMVLREQQVTISATMGLSVHPRDGASAEELLRHTDIALNEARAQSLPCVAYRPAMEEALNAKLSLARDFRAALAADELEVHFQPQFTLPGRKICGAEALLRWHDANRGWVSPGVLIPVLEERRMMSELGPWLFARVAAAIRQWQQAGYDIPGPISINLSAEQLEDDGIVEQILGTMEKAAVNPVHVGLELTETGIMKDPERSALITRRLKRAGFQLSIDDFGTGYSSMSYLKRLPADVIKVDMSFVREMLDDASDYAIVKTIIATARALGMETLAEGVETEAQARALSELCCDYAQGYLVGSPCTPEEFARRWLRGREPVTNS
ncbi:EAL domain-containing protein [Natronospira sp.]|uniref:EAL domain-containing protein n=1 Tax=Natronospira sp. TaxID=2024970 RepID=UPI0038730D4A